MLLILITDQRFFLLLLLQVCISRIAAEKKNKEDSICCVTNSILNFFQFASAISVFFCLLYFTFELSCNMGFLAFTHQKFFLMAII
uniref:THH1/TOM1/TOM3 domain-containing protein n=1 Tax=Brassica oleracea var. oleracea TaxID=109376 RepID=A0A0D3DV59_BRAOL